MSWARAPMLNDAIWLLVASGTYRSRPSEETETSQLLARATIDGSHVRTASPQSMSRWKRADRSTSADTRKRVTRTPLAGMGRLATMSPLAEAGGREDNPACLRD